MSFTVATLHIQNKRKDFCSAGHFFAILQDILEHCTECWNDTHFPSFLQWLVTVYLIEILIMEMQKPTLIWVCVVHFLVNETLAEGWGSYTKEEPANKIWYRIHNSVMPLRRSKRSEEFICQSSLTVVWGLLLETLISWYF